MNFFCFFGVPKRPCRIPIGDLGGSDPGEHFWAAKPHKHRGRSRPNRGFCLRSFFRPTVAQAGLRSGLTSAQYRTQTAHFDQNTASVSVFWVQSMVGLEEGENDGLDWE